MELDSILARGLQFLIALSGAYLLALWFVLIVWAYRDIETRSRSVVTQIFSTLLVVLFYIPGLLLYWLLRPKETLDVAFQRSLEEEYLLQDLEELPLCQSCQRYVQDDFLLCPHCNTQLREPCLACTRLVDLRWSICPFCAAAQDGRESENQPKPETAPNRWTSPALRRRKRQPGPLSPPSVVDDERLVATVAGQDSLSPFRKPAASSSEETPSIAAEMVQVTSALNRSRIRRIDRFRANGNLDDIGSDAPSGYSDASLPRDITVERSANGNIAAGHLESDHEATPRLTTFPRVVDSEDSESEADGSKIALLNRAKRD
ncbi:MAG: zinc ribbon domain-containing protein [Chloroflexota bacterium]|nr:zinc ribbon domain-containing protein [Chloroflexota bacterium]